MKKSILSVIAMLVMSNQSRAAKVIVEVPESTHQIEFLNVRVASHFFHKVRVEGCDASIQLEGGSDCTEDVKVDHPVLVISYRINTHTIENDPVDGGSISEMMLSLKNMSEQTKSALISGSAEDRLALIKRLATVKFVEEENMQLLSCETPFEGGSICPNIVSSEVTRKSLIVELN
ncbi:MAG: hypothetical protein A4S09_13615 [Proteobacteria bacterium SG_bin7]|nr:MAG: hypothetical protein A4S09_13615 [Proteobacteria bacterium SG_bin7]